MASRASSATNQHDARTSVLAAVAERAYFSTARLADEVRVDPARTDVIVHDLEAAGHIPGRPARLGPHHDRMARAPRRPTAPGAPQAAGPGTSARWRLGKPAAQWSC